MTTQKISKRDLPIERPQIWGDIFLFFFFIDFIVKSMLMPNLYVVFHNSKRFLRKRHFKWHLSTILKCRQITLKGNFFIFSIFQFVLKYSYSKFPPGSKSAISFSKFQIITEIWPFKKSEMGTSPPPNFGG